MGYVGNIVSFLAHLITLKPGHHLFNYADKPDVNTADLVSIANEAFGRTQRFRIKIPYLLGLCAGYGLDVVASVSGRKFPISAIRIKKFCADTTVSADKLNETGFTRPYTIATALQRTIASEFNLPS